MPKIGLWLPGRTDISQPITPDRPAHIDARLREKMLIHLESKGFEVFPGLDFRKAYVKDGEVWLNDFNMSQLDAFYWMGMIDRSYDSYHMEMLRVLSRTVDVRNSWEFYSVGTDKFLAFSILHQHGIPVSELYLVSPENYHFLEKEFETSRFLLKPRRSHFGSGIIQLDNYEHLRDTIEYTRNKDFYLEKFYENNLAEWTGVTVLSGKTVYGFRKESDLVAGWKIYDENHVGGKTKYVKPDAEQTRIAEAIGQILGGTHYGLDFIKTPDGYRVVDINMSPGIYWDFFEELELEIGAAFFKIQDPTVQDPRSK